jgi:hypothetical protein
LWAIERFKGIWQYWMQIVVKKSLRVLIIRMRLWNLSVRDIEIDDRQYPIRRGKWCLEQVRTGFLNCGNFDFNHHLAKRKLNCVVQVYFGVK